MAESVKIPGSSYEELIKIIKAYGTGKIGTPMSLDTVAQTAGMDKTIVSRNNGFLVQLGIISEGSKKSPTQLGSDLGRAYSLNMDEQIVRIWRESIESNEFLSRMLSAIKIRNGMEKTSFINHILYSSGSSTNNNTRAGAATIIEIYKTAKLVTEADGKIVALDTDENELEINNISLEQAPQTMGPSESIGSHYIPPIQTSSTNITININISPSIDDFDVLSEKLLHLIKTLNEQE